MGKFTERDFRYLDHNLDKEIAKRLRPLGLLNLFFLFFLIVSLILWIWLDWRMVLKMAGTAFTGLCITAFIYHSFKNVIKREIKKKLEDLTGPDPKTWNKSPFQQKLEEMEANCKKRGCSDWCGNPDCRQFCKEKSKPATCLMTNEDYRSFIEASTHRKQIGHFNITNKLLGSGIEICIDLLEYGHHQPDRRLFGQALVRDLQKAASPYHTVILYANGKILE